MIQRVFFRPSFRRNKLLGRVFFCDSNKVFSNSSNLTRKSRVFLRQSPGRRVFCNARVFCDGVPRRGFFAMVQRVFFATVQWFFLRQFRRVKKRSGWYSVHRTGSGATLSVVAVV